MKQSHEWTVLSQWYTLSHATHWGGMSMDMGRAGSADWQSLVGCLTHKSSQMHLGYWKS